MQDLMLICVFFWEYLERIAFIVKRIRAILLSKSLDAILIYTWRSRQEKTTFVREGRLRPADRC